MRIRMPEGMSYATGALIEPLGVAYHAVVRANPKLGQSVVVAGAGPIGLSMALCARAAGAHPVLITDLEDNRLAQARELGFDKTLKIDMNWGRLEAARRIREAMGGWLPDIVFECTGSVQSINSACYVRPTARIHQTLLITNSRLSVKVASCFKSDVANQIFPCRSWRCSSKRSVLFRALNRF